MEVTVKSNRFTSFGGNHPVTKVPFSFQLEDGTAVIESDVANYLKGLHPNDVEVEEIISPNKEEIDKLASEEPGEEKPEEQNASDEKRTPKPRKARG